MGVGRPKRPDFEKIKQNNISFASFGEMPAPMVSGPRIERPNIETPWIDNAVDIHCPSNLCCHVWILHVSTREEPMTHRWERLHSHLQALFFQSVLIKSSWLHIIRVRPSWHYHLRGLNLS